MLRHFLTSLNPRCFDTDNGGGGSPPTSDSPADDSDSQAPAGQTPDAAQTAVNADAILEKNRQLLAEKKSLQEKYEQLAKAAEEKQREELEAQEKFKELYEQRNTEYEEIKPYKDKYEELHAEWTEYQTKQLDELKTGVDEDIADAIITNDRYSFTEKVEKLKKLGKGAVSSPDSSPASNRGTIQVGDADWKKMDLQARIEALHRGKTT
jgi:DNA repair exonuclease SbcCD ATPase subunit